MKIKLLFIFLLSIHFIAFGAPKNDWVVVSNGNKLRCEIKTLKENKIVCKTTNFGTVSVKWDRVTHVYSKNTFRIELRNGMLLTGSLDSTEIDRVVRILETKDSLWTEVPTAEIVAMYQINQSIFEQIDGTLGVGYSFTKSSNIHSFNGKTTLQYLAKKNLLEFNANGIYTMQSDTITTSKSEVHIQDQHLFHNNWFTTIGWSIQQNTELGLRARNIGTITYGKYLIKENQTFLSLSFGGAVNNERYYENENGVTKTAQLNYEGVISLGFRAFTNNTPEFNIYPTWIVYPSFTQAGRWRSDFNIESRLEIYHNIYVTLSYYNQFDNKPPDSGTKVDFGFVGSVDWKF